VASRAASAVTQEILIFMQSINGEDIDFAELAEDVMET
jgi:hypothetical protein